MPEIERTSPNSARVSSEFRIPPDKLTAALSAAIESLPRWSLEVSDEGKLHAVRKTRVFRFKDDIRISVKPSGEGSRLEAESKSRVGKGDLGQNPKNLQELLGALRGEVGSTD